MTRMLIVCSALFVGICLPAQARSTQSTAKAACTATAAKLAGTTPVCTVRGTVGGRYTTENGFITGGSITITWTGQLVLVKKTSAAQPTFEVAEGSSVTWKLTGRSTECTFDGSGTVRLPGLIGTLTIFDWLGPGSWKWDLSVTAVHGVSGPTMPYTAACTGGTSTLDAAGGFEGLIFGYNGYSTGQPPANLITDGKRFTSTIHTPPGNEDWTVALTGKVFADAISEHGLAFIKREEALRVHAYNDQTHNCTIGYGYLLHLGVCTAAEAKLTWTPQEADQKLRERLARDFEPEVRAFSNRVGLDQCQFDALESFAYNTSNASWKSLTQGLTGAGTNDFRYQVLRRILSYIKAKDAVTQKYVVVPALVKRRLKEEALFMHQYGCTCAGVG